MVGGSCCREEQKIILMDPVLVDIYLTQQQKASPIRRKKGMSRKERRDAITALLEMVRQHEGDWKVEKLISEFSLRHGYKRKTVEGYVGDLVIAGQLIIAGDHVYRNDIKTSEKEAAEK